MDDNSDTAASVNEASAVARAAKLAASRATEIEHWQHFALNFEEAETEASSTSPDWQCCAVCGRNWIPHRRRADDAAINELCSFDVPRALNRLIVRLHATHDSSANDAYMKAYSHLFANLQTLAPERLAETRLVEAVVPARPLLDAFLEAARAGGRVCRWRSQWETVELAATLVQQLVPLLERIEADWVFDSTGRSLPGTKKGDGRPPKLLLAEVEAWLREGGVRPTDIARLDLDGELEARIPGSAGVTDLDGLTSPIAQPPSWPEFIKRAEGRVAGRKASFEKAHAEATKALLAMADGADESPKN